MPLDRKYVTELTNQSTKPNFRSYGGRIAISDLVSMEVVHKLALHFR